MRQPWISSAALVLVVALGNEPVLAQTPPKTFSLGNAVRAGWFHMRLTGGRIVVTGARVGNMSPHPTTVGGTVEKITIRNVNGNAVVTYQMTSPEEQLSFELGPADRVVLRREGQKDPAGTQVLYEQVPGGPVVLTVGPPARQEVYKAATLWHLLLAQPQAARQHLLPLLDLLRPEWKLRDAADSLENELVRLARAGELPDRRRWDGWIGQLADDSFAVRQAADRELRRLGPGVRSYLEHLDLRRLDAEQQSRVRRILQALSSRSADDAPEQVATWLATDPWTWHALLDRPSLADRQLAAAQLAALLGEPLAFDPSADEATRRKQADQVRARIEAKYPRVAPREDTPGAK